MDNRIKMKPDIINTLRSLEVGEVIVIPVVVAKTSTIKSVISTLKTMRFTTSEKGSITETVVKRIS